MRRTCLVLLALLPLTATARMPWGDKAPWAEVDGSAVAATAADPDAVALAVIAVDRKPLERPKEKLTLVPGPQRLTVASTRRSATGTVAVPYTFVAEACMRYHLAGKQPVNDTRLDVSVISAERIADCRAPVVAAAPAVAAPVTEVAQPAPEAAAPVTDTAVAAPVSDTATAASPSSL
jgi:hypothetical protein